MPFSLLCARTLHYSILTGFLCYDDGCHLKKFACNSRRKDSTNTSKWISSMNIVVDKLHFRGHTDKWCHENCNPNDFVALEKVLIHVCVSTCARHITTIPYYGAGWHWGLWASFLMDVQICQDYTAYEQVPLPLLFTLPVWLLRSDVTNNKYCLT